MSSLEKEYYEQEEFWDPAHSPFGQSEQQRVVDTYSMLPPDVDSLLDAGCGNGLFCNYLQQRKPDLRIVALDRSQTALRYVRTEKREGDIADLPFADQTFDCVTSLEVIEHLPIPTYERALAELARVARKCVIISVPNNQHLEKELTQCPACRSRFHPHRHVRSFNEDTMRGLLVDLGFRCEVVQHLGHHTCFAGVHLYLKLRRRRPPLMASTLCPICGYRNPAIENRPAPTERKDASPATGGGVKGLLKRCWPKNEGHWWLAALYRRV